MGANLHKNEEISKLIVVFLVSRIPKTGNAVTENDKASAI
jgi:hypothetical protein